MKRSLPAKLSRLVASRLLTAAALLVLGMAAQPANADIKTLVGRAPADTNAVVAIDVTAVLASPVATAQGWGTRDDAPIFLQKGAQRLVVASRFNFSKLESDWDVAILDMSPAPTLSALTIAENGLSDKFGDLPGIWSSRKAYFIQFEPTVLGIATPDDRQFAARWARAQGNRPAPGLSSYLQTAAAKTTATTPMVIALDLQDAISLKKVQRALISDLSRATLLKDTPSAKVADVLATLKGVTATFQFAGDISGRLVMDFGSDPALLAPVAVPLLTDVMTSNGLGLSELGSWTAAPATNQLVYTGKLTVPAFTKLNFLLQPASTAAPLAAAAAPAPAPAAHGTTPPAAANPQAATIEASQKYYKAVCATIDGLGQPASLGDGAAWLRRASQRIEKLPMANVDPELLAWGTQICADLLGMAQQLANGQTQLSAKSAGAYFNNATTTVVSNDQWDGGLQVRADNERLVNSQREATQSERARITEPVTRRLSEIMASKMTMRASLVSRYKVEF